MKFQAITGNFTEAPVEAIAVAVFKGEKANSGVLKDLDKMTGGLLANLVKSEEFKADSGETALIRFNAKNGRPSRLLLVGMGDKADYKPYAVATLSGTAARFLRKRNIKSFALLPRIQGDPLLAAQNSAQGFVTSQFELDKYKTRDRMEHTVTELGVFIDGADVGEINKGLERGRVIGEAMNFTRDLANEPPNILTPTEVAKRAQIMARETGLKCEILDEAKMAKLGMGSLLSVSHGSSQPAKMIVLRYTPESGARSKNRGLLALVGKGITFDTGGISIKPAEGMDAMKYDMSGGATVIGTMRAIAKLRPSIPVLGIVAAVENMPDGSATRPSDVVTAMTGKTIEILNTDAEGRLILADAVAYAESLGATSIVDMATLTGAVIIALGDQNTGIMGNDQPLVDEIIACGKEAGEGFWQLPLSAEYSKQIRSDIADIKNIGPRGKAGTIMGAVFIQEFIDKAKWAHLDIAGTAWADGARAHQAKGPTGVAVRTLLTLVESRSSSS